MENRSWEKKKRGKWRIPSNATGVSVSQGPPLGAPGVLSGDLRGFHPLRKVQTMPKKEICDQSQLVWLFPSAGVPKTGQVSPGHSCCSFPLITTFGHLVLSNLRHQLHIQKSLALHRLRSYTTRHDSRRVQERACWCCRSQSGVKPPTSQAESAGEWGRPVGVQGSTSSPMMDRRAASMGATSFGFGR